MSWFQLDAESLAKRTESVPTLNSFVWRGALGFTLVSVAGFMPWGVFGKWFRGHGGELLMYVVCAVVFIVLSGLLLHRLILGTGTLGRFYKVFGISFTAYSIAWIAGWMAFRGHLGSVVGLLAGTVAMGGILVMVFDAQRQWWKVIAALFVLNSLGYFIGGVIEEALVGVPECSVGGVTLASPTQLMIAKMQWAVCYGLGFGAGLGVAFYLCQSRAREIVVSIRSSGK